MALSQAEARALVEAHGSRRAAARAAGIHHNTFAKHLDPERWREQNRRAAQAYRDRHPGRHADAQARYLAGLPPAERARLELEGRRRAGLRGIARRANRNFSITDAIELLEGGQ